MSDLKKVKILWDKFQVILSKSQKKWAVVVFFFTLIGSVLETAGVSIIVPLIQVMVQPSAVRENEIGAMVLSYISPISDRQIMFLIGGLVVFIYIFKNVYLSCLAYIRIKYSCKVQRELSVKIANSYVKRGYPFFLRVSAGELLRGIGSSISGVYRVLNQFFKILAELLTIICICIFLILKDVLLAGSIIALALVCVGLTTLIFRKRVRHYGNIAFRYSSIVSQNQLQLFYGIKEVLVMRRERHFLDAYENAYIQSQKANANELMSAELPAYIIEGICISGIILAVCVRVTGLDSPIEYLPQLAAFAVAAFRILPSLGRISSGVNACVYNLKAVDETYQNVLELNRCEREGNDRLADASGQNDVHFERSITVENVFWKYEGGKSVVLDGVNLEIKKGQSVAFIGPSGAGKTTLGDVILGLLIPQSGKVCIDGVDIGTIGTQLSEIIGFVPQSIYMTDDTIRNNIAFGIEDAKIDDEKIWRALEKAQMKEFIMELPDKLDTLIGERGMRLSGGQRQRLAIARALYLDPQILVLDEATSALDTETENAVMESIDALQGEKTLIIIAHRLSTIRNCDVIYEITDGKAIERNISDVIKEAE